MALAYEEAARLEGDLAEALLQRDEMEEQRDRARDVAVALEQELAARDGNRCTVSLCPCACHRCPSCRWTEPQHADDCPRFAS